MLMLLATIMLVFANTAHAQTQISISAAPPGGPWYVGMGAYAKVINSLFPELNATVFPGVGTANVVHVGQGKSQVGVTCVALMAAGVEGSEPYKKPQAILGLANFNDLSYQFVGIPEGSGIESIEQMIRDKARARINLGSKPGGYAELFSRWLLDGYGVDRKTLISCPNRLIQTHNILYFNILSKIIHPGKSRKSVLHPAVFRVLFRVFIQIGILKYSQIIL